MCGKQTDVIDKSRPVRHSIRECVVNEIENFQKVLAAVCGAGQGLAFVNVCMIWQQFSWLTPFTNTEISPSRTSRMTPRSNDKSEMMENIVR